MGLFYKFLIIRKNRSLQIFGHFFITLNLQKIVLFVTISASKRWPLTFRKVAFCTLKGLL